jgi:antitoxin PrlF
MNVVQNNTSHTSQEFESSVSPKGQITLPIEFRKKLGVHTKDKVLLKLEDDGIKVVPTRSKIDELFGSIPPLPKPLTLAEMRQVYQDELAQKFAEDSR